MITLRCTQVVWERLHLPKDLPERLPPTCALGDWYINLVRFGHSEFVGFSGQESRALRGSSRDFHYVLRF